MKQIGIDQVKELVTELERINTAITGNDNAIIAINETLGMMDNSIIDLSNDITELNNVISELNGAIGEVNDDISELNSAIATKQDVLIAGTGIAIENNVISNTQTSAEWGNIEGEITEQNDLMGLLDDKQDVLTAGDGIVINNNVISSSVTAGSTINLLYENIVVSDWVEDNTYVNFTYKADIECPDVTSNMYAIVTYDYADSVSGDYANFCETGEDTVTVWSNSNSMITIPNIVAFGFANVLTFIIKNSSNDPINGATVAVGSYTANTDANGVARLTNVANGLYTYTISAELYEIKTGTINVYNNSLTVSETLLLIPLDAYAAESIVLGNAVKLNAGVGDSDQDYNVYASNTVITNDLTLDAVAASTTSAGSVAQVELANPNNMDIMVQALDENNAPIDADIEFNNSNEIDEVNFIIEAKDIYVAFTKGDDMMYFKNDTIPFIPMSDKTFESKSYTYYTYENGAMVSHNATTSSVTSDRANTYDGTTLNLDTSDTFSNGIWTRDVNEDLEIDNGDATITTSSYLTDINPIIPRTDNFIFRVEKLNPSVWDTKLIIGGQEKSFINLQEFVVKSNQLIEIYATKHDSTDMKDTYNKYFYISNDKIYKKVTYTINVNVSANIKFTINGINFVYSGSTASIDCYEGETIKYEVSASGWNTVSGSYIIPSYPTNKTPSQSVLLTKLKNAQIVGTLTENNGVFSGFAQNNYLKLNTVTPTTDFDFIIKCNTGSSYGDLLRTQPDGAGILLRCSNSSIICYLSSTGNGWNVLSNFDTGITMTANADMYIKISWHNGTYTFYQSSDGINWTERNSSSSGLNAPYWNDNTQTIGACDTYTEYWSGTVDMKETYIDVDGNTINFWENN